MDKPAEAGVGSAVAPDPSPQGSGVQEPRPADPSGEAPFWIAAPRANISPVQTLTGRAAAEAIGTYARLGAANARFDDRRVRAAMSTSRGRLRVAAALTRAILNACGAAVRGIPPTQRRSRENGSQRVRRAATDVGSERPRLDLLRGTG